MSKETQYQWWDASNLTSELYLNTRREDWFAIARELAREIEGGRTILDIGVGDGHTTRQLLSRIRGKYVCDIIEPDQQGLSIAKRRLAGFPIRDAAAATIASYFAKLDAARKWDRIVAVHSNYYWDRPSGETEMTLRWLAGRLAPQGKIVIATAPGAGDFYIVAGRNPFHDGVYAEFVADHFTRSGMRVSVTQMQQRFYVGEALEDKLAARKLFAFFTDDTREPNARDLTAFQRRLRRTAKDDYIDFKDRIIVAQTRS